MQRQLLVISVIKFQLQKRIRDFEVSGHLAKRLFTGCRVQCYVQRGVQGLRLR